MVNYTKHNKKIQNLKYELSAINNRLSELHSSGVINLGEVKMLERRRKELQSSIEDCMKVFQDDSA